MFELGLRLAFDKPTVIIKDDKTEYSFDTGVIEHIAYPRDLRFTKVVEFKRRLAEKIAATYKAGQTDPDHSPFLKNFGQFKVASLHQTEISPEKAILEILSDVQQDIAVLKNRSSMPRESPRQSQALMNQLELALVKWRQQGNTVPPHVTPDLFDFAVREAKTPPGQKLNPTEFFEELKVALERAQF